VYITAYLRDTWFSWEAKSCSMIQNIRCFCGTLQPIVIFTKFITGSAFQSDELISYSSSLNILLSIYKWFLYKMNSHKILYKLTEQLLLTLRTGKKKNNSRHWSGNLQKHQQVNIGTESRMKSKHKKKKTFWGQSKWTFHPVNKSGHLRTTYFCLNIHIIQQTFN
jgi:hypothetical protein